MILGDGAFGKWLSYENGDITTNLTEIKRTIGQNMNNYIPTYQINKKKQKNSLKKKLN